METWMALVSIMAIVAVVLVAGGIIAFIAHLIIGALDRTDKNIKYEGRTELLDYAQYKQSQEANKQNEYDFEAINKAKVAEEKALIEDEVDDDFEIEDNLVDEIAKDLEEEKVAEPVEEKVKKVEEVKIVEEDDDDLDFDAMLEEISNDIIEEEKEKATEENAPKMSDELGTYSLEEYMNSLNEETEEVEETVEEVPVVEEVEPVAEEIAAEVVAEESLEETEDEGDEALEILPEIEEVEEIEEEPIVEEVVEPVEEKEDESKKIIEDLKAQLADLNKQLEAARSSKTEVVTINMTEEECVARLNMLEERLKDVKKDYKNNMKEYRPLKKVMNDLEKYQTKLRRKDTIVAKKKVALYGVNNYVDIDKEKAEKLANDLELLEGLRLSVSHCEEVINANKDRYPILERTNQILEDQIAHIEADIASTQATLAKIREENGEGENQ